ncbi:TIR domain-containing protein [uncultured Desulfosarcina sp.]|uniref:TIR domain-containing protein n=1 Tax=uncultured Desulfosarcina sp. TaxID=218289 RepID=UPI0029C5FDC6|nr:TIR domain-containing protein [uncultured Desulfosarcina sp.]
MITRFQGKEGKRRLVDALRRQQIICGDETVANAIADAGEITEYASGKTIIQNCGSDSDLYFLLAGSVDIIVNQRVVASRVSGQHIGEMALLDPSALRCADVVAKETVVACTVSEPIYTRIAEKAPILWRHIAIELADRLRQRNRLVIAPNSRPHLFIGSSVESLNVARAIQVGLEHDDVTIKVWTDGVFGASTFPIESLENEIRTADFGLLVLSPDDHVISRGTTQSAPRDNVVFELGMCIGALTRIRSFLVHPRGVDLRIPTDLLGLTPLTYAVGPDGDLDAAMGSVCELLRRVVSERSVK